jgi:hypothetical protein
MSLSIDWIYDAAGRMGIYSNGAIRINPVGLFHGERTLPREGEVKKTQSGPVPSLGTHQLCLLSTCAETGQDIL